MGAQTNPGKTRSPNYPAIGLEEAIQRLKSVYEKQQRYPATREVVAQLMGYKGLNGASATVVSALSKYGLLEGYGETLRVSELGQDLALHRKGDPEYATALRTAAFMPTFFQEMRDQYSTGLPHDHSLRAALIKRGFNPKAIDSAVRGYRDTMDYLDAELGESNPGSAAQDKLDEEGTPRKQPVDPANDQDSPPPGQRAVSIPLSLDQWATLYAAFPLTDAAWTQMLAVLEAMKPALVTPTGASFQAQAGSSTVAHEGGQDDD